MDKLSPAELFREALNSLLKKQGHGSQARLADSVRISRSVLNDIVKGRTGGPEELREKLAQELGFTYEGMISLGRKLTGGDDPKSAKITPDNIEIPGKLVRQIPIISWVQAGDWKEAVEEVATDYVFTDLPNQNMFALQVQGDSMEPKFNDGDIIIIDPDAECEHDAYVVVMNGEGEATFKQLKIYKGVYVLHPLNDKYSEKIVDSKEIRCIGRAVQKIVRERL